MTLLGMRWLGLSIAHALYGNTPGVQGAVFHNARAQMPGCPPELATVGFDPPVTTPWFAGIIDTGWPFPPADTPSLPWMHWWMQHTPWRWVGPL